MPTYRMQAPDGNTYQVEGPEGATEDQVRAEIIRQNPQLGGGGGQPAAATTAPEDAYETGQAAREKKIADVLGNFDISLAPKSVGRAIRSVPGSAAGVVGSVTYPVRHPQEFYEGMTGLGAGILEKLGMKKEAGNAKYADAVGRFFADRYGGWDNIVKTFETDPVGMLADVSSALSVAGLAGRAPGVVGEVGQIAGRVGSTIDPVLAGARATGAGLRTAGRVASYPVGVTTGAGHHALQTAEQAGYEGGQAGQIFRQNLRAGEPERFGLQAETVADARGAVNQLYRERGQEYVNAMRAVQADTTPLDWGRIDNALANIAQVKVHPTQGGLGLVMDEATQAIRQRIAQTVQQWKQAIGPNPTMADLDALKQTIYNMRNLPDFHEHSASQAVVSQATNAIGETIRQHNPGYARIMEGYQNASNAIDEIERTLSLNPNASIDTALRKLQSTMRDNVSTNFGQRRALADLLVQHGAPHLMERLAGQSLNPVAPRGLSRLLAGEVSNRLLTVAGVHGAGAAATGGAGLPFMSPYLMGEAAHKIGQARRYAGQAAPYASAAEPAAYVAGRVSKQLDPRTMIQEDAKALLKEGGLSYEDAVALRRAARGNADSRQMLRAKEIAERISAQHETKAQRFSGDFDEKVLGDLRKQFPLDSEAQLKERLASVNRSFGSASEKQRYPDMSGLRLNENWNRMISDPSLIARGAAKIEDQRAMAPAPGESSYQGPQ